MLLATAEHLEAEAELPATDSYPAPHGTVSLNPLLNEELAGMAPAFAWGDGEVLHAGMATEVIDDTAEKSHPRRQPRDVKIVMCTAEGCNKSARAGGLVFCKAHGGGRRCKADVSQTGGQPCPRSSAAGGFCVVHGGGKRCVFPNCERAARAGGVQYCAGHGGGRRCQHPGCNKSARAGGDCFCAAHGGGVRCSEKGCDKSATSAGERALCIKHGGGKRCTEPGCEKSSASGGEPGRCIGHGGGHRCERDGCTKSVPSGSALPLCKAHGGVARPGKTLADPAVVPAVPAGAAESVVVAAKLAAARPRATAKPAPKPPMATAVTWNVPVRAPYPLDHRPRTASTCPPQARAPSACGR
jgi:hypothetical protein